MSDIKKEQEWTPTPMQRLALEDTDRTLLVSAAAGSGKTKTLTQRIIKRITKDNIDISKMLIVTFTRAATAELRLKIYSAITQELAKDPGNTQLSNQLTKLNNAKICTMDSFYLDILKNHFTEANVSPSFRTIDTEECIIIEKKAMDDAIEELYETNKDFPLFVECFTSIRSSKKLNETFLTIYSALSTIPSGIEYIKESAENLSSQSEFDFFETDFGKMIKKRSTEFFTHYKTNLEYAYEIADSDENIKKAYGKTVQDDLAFCSAVLTILNDPNSTYENVKQCFEGFSSTEMKRISSSTEDSVLVKKIRDKYAEKKEKLYVDYYASTPSTIRQAMKETAAHTATLYALLKNFNERMEKQKKNLDFLTFNDVCRKVYGLLIQNEKPTELAKKISLEYSDIYIDEYQDVNSLQDDIFKAISTPTNRFMVGDIKQSIYKFRGAEPTLFSDYRKSFPDITEPKKAENATIFMSNNFRCDRNVIDFTNIICENLFKNANGCIKYEDGDNLQYSKDKTKDQNKNVSLNVIYVPKGSKTNQAESVEEDSAAKKWESEFIASEIQKLINEEKIPHKDITVLFRTKTISPYISEALRKRNIKVSEVESSKYFENADVLMMLCILNSIDNPERDTYLAGTLRSPLFNLTSDDLFTLRTLYPEPYSLFGALCAYMNEHNDELSQKCHTFYEKLIFWQESAASTSIDRFLLMLFNDDTVISSGILANQSEDGEGGNLLLLYEYARCFQGTGFKGVYEFIEYINTLIDEDQSLPETSKGKADDRVSLMSIHKAKGLEFPVCFLASSGKHFSTEESKQSLILNHPMGIAMKLADTSGFAVVDTPLREILLSELFRDNAEEEIRMLYVALTRAVNRLIVVGTSQSKKETLLQKAKINAICNDSYSILCDSKSYIDWILLSLEKYTPSFVDINFLTPENITLSPDKDKEDETVEITTETDKELLEKLSTSFGFEYQYSDLSRIPSKLSVSRLYPDMLDTNDTSLDLSKKDKPATVPAFFSDKTVTPSAAERGTATHLFFQFCNFEYAATRGVDEELTRLFESKYLPANAENLIYKDELQKFIESDLLKQIASAKDVIREQRFNISLPVSNFTKNEALIEKMKDEPLAVQGVIDLILVDKNGNIKLFDYKTDRLSTKELKNPDLAKAKLNAAHATQLSYYAKAVEIIFGKPCESVQIYSTHSGLLYDIDVNVQSDIL